MNIYNRKIRWKFLLLILAILIGVGSLYYTRVLVDKLADEEKKKVEIWAQATTLISTNNSNDNKIVEFLFESINDREILNLMLEKAKEKYQSASDFKEDSILKKELNDYRKILTNSRLRKKVASNVKQNNNSIDDFIFQILINNKTIPVVLTTDKDSVISENNFRKKEILKKGELLKKWIAEKREEGKVLEIKLQQHVQYIYYDNSMLLTKLKYFPFIQLGVILLFILVAYLAFNASRNAEQNQVWLGLSKETAHQLGTPTSSLMAWVEILKEKDIEDHAIKELDKDVQRLKKITDRFSKIGSRPKLTDANVIEVLNNALEYIRSRSSNKVKINLKTSESELMIPLNIELFEWVIENICKNAIDAMEGSGEIDVNITDNMQVIYIDITDTGRGVPKSKFKTIFKPGYTTKERGWGLGLSLSKRIIENYHDGKIFVHFSEMGKGTRFRVVLKKFF